jgi:hypothetical protein
MTMMFHKDLSREVDKEAHGPTGGIGDLERESQLVAQRAVPEASCVARSQMLGATQFAYINKLKRGDKFFGPPRR